MGGKSSKRAAKKAEEAQNRAAEQAECAYTVMCNNKRFTIICN